MAALHASRVATWVTWRLRWHAHCTTARETLWVRNSRTITSAAAQPALSHSLSLRLSAHYMHFIRRHRHRQWSATVQLPGTVTCTVARALACNHRTVRQPHCSFGTVETSFTIQKEGGQAGVGNGHFLKLSPATLQSGSNPQTECDQKYIGSHQEQGNLHRA